MATSTTPTIEEFADAIDKLSQLTAQIVRTAVPSKKIVTMGINCDTPGRQPFAYGHPFKRGDVPIGSSVVAMPEFQCIPQSFYDDGSVCRADIAGYVAPTAPGLVLFDLVLSPRVNPPFPNALAALISKNPQAVVDCGPFGSVTLSSLLGANPAYTVVSGPLMSQWKFCGPVGNDLHLQVTFEVRLFKGGEVEIFPPRLENCWFDEPGSTNKLITLVTVTIDGKVTFSEPIDVKHHTRPLCHRGNDWSYWIGTTAKHTPHHDANYLHSCECMTPHKVEDPDPSALATVPQIYFPNYIGEDGTGMSAAGNHISLGAMIGRSSAFYLTTQEPVLKRRAFHYMMALAESASSWSNHWRDKTTGHLPLFSKYPNHGNTSNSGKPIVVGTGPRNGDWDIAHHPSLAYVAAMVTGRYDLVEEHLFWSVACHFANISSIRLKEKGIISTLAGANTDRGAFRAMRTLTQSISLCPKTHPLYPELIRVLEENVRWYDGVFIRGTILPPAPATPVKGWDNKLGILGVCAANVGQTSGYANPADIGTSKAWYFAYWMHSLGSMVMGQMRRASLPLSADAVTAVKDLHEFTLELIEGMGEANWRWQFSYAVPCAPDGSKSPAGQWYSTQFEMMTEMLKGKNLPVLDLSPGQTLKRHDSTVDINADDWRTGVSPSNGWGALVYGAIFNRPRSIKLMELCKTSKSWELTTQPESAGGKPWKNLPSWRLEP